MQGVSESLPVIIMKGYEIKEETVEWKQDGEVVKTVYNSLDYSANISWEKDDPSDLETYEILAFLIAEEEIFINPRKGESIKLFVNCNDVFAWGCADLEEIGWDELSDLFFKVIADRKWGSLKWCCLKRNERPQLVIEKDMKAENAWDEKLDALPENHYWKMYLQDHPNAYKDLRQWLEEYKTKAATV